jgi:hypothetical protein
MSGDFTLVSTTNTNTITGNVLVNSNGNTTITFNNPINESIMFSSQEDLPYSITLILNGSFEIYNGYYSGISTNEYKIAVTISEVTGDNVVIISINISLPPSLNYSTAEVQNYQNTRRRALMVLKNLDPEDNFTKMGDKEQIANEVAKIELNGKRLNVSLKEIAKIILKNVKY